MSLKKTQLRQQQQKNNIVLLLQDIVMAYQMATMSRKWLMEQSCQCPHQLALSFLIRDAGNRVSSFFLHGRLMLRQIAHKNI